MCSGITWMTKDGLKQPNYYGSLTHGATMRVGNYKGEEVHVPFSSLLPMVHPNDFVLGGWDISGLNLAEAMERAQVLDFELQKQLVPYMRDIVPLPGIYDPAFIAANQADRADNVISGSRAEQVEAVRGHIRAFKAAQGVDRVVVLWTANTERYSEVAEGLNDTADNLLAAIEANHSGEEGVLGWGEGGVDGAWGWVAGGWATGCPLAVEGWLERQQQQQPVAHPGIAPVWNCCQGRLGSMMLGPSIAPASQQCSTLLPPTNSAPALYPHPSAEVSPSTLYATACVLEGVPFINGAPQNTFVPGLIELAVARGVLIAGDDFKSGQTKMKSVLVDFLVGAGIKPTSIVSYNHLGNNDGRNLSAPQTFRSKEISKSNVVDDMVASNSLLYAPGEHPDHVVVIKYVPYVADSKR